MNYVPTIGIECHVQLATKTKLFSSSNNDARGLDPNVAVSEIDFGLPGVLPILNEAVIDLAIKAGKALNAEVALFSKFDRKHYFYPDSPKGYQITQFDEPTVGRGAIDVPHKDSHFSVGITRAHIEGDAGKLVHHSSLPMSLVDLNRAGTPLLEIVSEPDIHSPEQARAFAEELQRLMRYADVSYGDLFHGNMRFDVNISLAPEGSKELGTRAEIKNLNSFRSVERAAQYEIERQTEILNSGEAVVQETRGWNDDDESTFSQRGKEDAHDYRYFPEPDVPPIQLTKERIKEVQATVTILPSNVRDALEGISVDESVKQTIVDEPLYARLYLKTVEQFDLGEKEAKQIALWISSAVAKLALDDAGRISSQLLHGILGLVDENKISSGSVKKIIEIAAREDPENQHAKQIADKNNLIQRNDDGFLNEIAETVIAENEKAAQDVRNGEEKAIGFLVGQVMKLSKGQANPAMAKEILKKILGV